MQIISVMKKELFFHDLVKVRQLLNWAFAGFLAEDSETKDDLFKRLYLFISINQSY